MLTSSATWAPASSRPSGRARLIMIDDPQLVARDRRSLGEPWTPAVASPRSCGGWHAPDAADTARRSRRSTARPGSTRPPDVHAGSAGRGHQRATSVRPTSTDNPMDKQSPRLSCTPQNRTVRLAIYKANRARDGARWPSTGEAVAGVAATSRSSCPAPGSRVVASHRAGPAARQPDPGPLRRSTCTRSSSSSDAHGRAGRDPLVTRRSQNFTVAGATGNDEVHGDDVQRRGARRVRRGSRADVQGPHDELGQDVKHSRRAADGPVRPEDLTSPPT